MPAIHDYRCQSCRALKMEQLEKPTDCECGNPQWEWTCEFWDKDKNPFIRRDFKTSNDLYTDLGYRRRFNVSDDPTCQIELCGDDKGISTFDIDQRLEYAGRLMKDGDTPALRREILKQRVENLKARGENAPEVHDL
jgi:hypothetical protein